MRIENTIAIVLSSLICVIFLTMGGMVGWGIASLVCECKAFPAVDYLSADLRSGDILLFSTNLLKVTGPVDALHMLVANSPVTHVGLVFRDPRHGMLRSWEVALGGGVPALLRLTNLHTQIATYRGTVMVRRLVSSVDRSARPGKEEDVRMQRAIRVILHNDRQRTTRYRPGFYLDTYDSTRNASLMCVHPPMPMAPTTTTAPAASLLHDDKEQYLTCTDLVADTLFAMGVFKATDRSLWPRDFYTRSEALPMRNALWHYQPEVRLNAKCRN